MNRFALAFLGLASIGCRRDRVEPPIAPTERASPRLVVDRPVHAQMLPEGREPVPLVLLLHGYGDDGRGILAGVGLGALVARGVALVAPDGTLDATGRRFWNANAACCDFEARGVDDVAYLRAVIDDVDTRRPIDRGRIYAVGISNGGAMALRLACEDVAVAAVVSIAAPSPTAIECRSSAVARRILHGERDRLVPLAGGAIASGLHPRAGGDLSSVRALATRHARAAGCVGDPIAVGSLDLDEGVAGDETTLERWSGCRAPVEIGIARDVAHVPRVGPAFVASTWAFLSAHVRR